MNQGANAGEGAPSGSVCRRPHHAALQAGCIALLPGIGQEADFFLQLGLALLRGRSAGVGDLLCDQAAVQAQEPELHCAGPCVLELQAMREEPGNGSCMDLMEESVLPPVESWDSAVC